VPVLAAPETVAVVRRRHMRLSHFRFVEMRAGARRIIGEWTIDCREVPHSGDPRVPTYAWRLRGPWGAVVYASDVARIDSRLARYASGAQVLVVDGATWHRTIFSHLRIDRDLPEICRWRVGRILLTQIGRSAPPHFELERNVARLCPRARPAYDGMVEPISVGVVVDQDG
jgi:hypothetical protein